MDEEVLVKVEGVSKKFCKDLKRSLRYGVQDIAREVVGLPVSQELRKKEFWAVDDISFELKRGECIGLIGHNGAGKSTLLKVLNGLIKPDKGKITMRGRVGALIELGAGFNPILTGRENIYINGQVLGFSKKEIDQKMEAIIDFSEIEEYLDTPVQNYSSGMKVRLGFAVAAQMEPDVLIIDEVLAVGDTGFKIKCLNRITELINDSAVVFVSHSMPQVARVSSSIMHMKGGGQIYYGKDIEAGIESYFNEFEGEEYNVFGEGGDISNIELNKKDDYEVQLKYLEDLSIEFEFTPKHEVQDLEVSIIFFDKNLRAIAKTKNDYQNISKGKKIGIYCNIPDLQFITGTYFLSIVFFDKSHGRFESLLHAKSIKKINFKSPASSGNAVLLLKSEWS